MKNYLKEPHCNKKKEIKRDVKTTQYCSTYLVGRNKTLISVKVRIRKKFRFCAISQLMGEDPCQMLRSLSDFENSKLTVGASQLPHEKLNIERD